MTLLRISPVHELASLRLTPSTLQHRFAFDIECEPELYEVLGNVVHRLLWDGGVSAVSDLEGFSFAVICPDWELAEHCKDYFEKRFLAQLTEKLKVAIDHERVSV